MTDVSADGPVTTPATATYSRIYEEEQPRLVAYARSLTGSAWVADDLVAEAHFRVWRRLSAGHEIENVPAYLMTTVRHLATTVGRGAARETPRDPHAPEGVEPAHGTGRVVGGAVSEDGGGSGDGHDVVDRLSSVELLRRVLGQLPERWVKALWLAEAEGQPLETVGRRIGAGQGATAVLLHRAREGMRQAFLRAHPGTPEDPACEPHWDRIPGHIRGEASARQSEQLLAHLDGCADCRGRLVLLTRANDRLPALVGPALLIFVLGGAGKFLAAVAAGAGAGAGASAGASAGAGAGSASGGGHGGFLHGVRHVLTGGGKVPAAAVGVAGVSVAAGAAVVAALVAGSSGQGVPPQRASVVERGVPESAPALPSAPAPAPVPPRVPVSTAAPDSSPDRASAPVPPLGSASTSPSASAGASADATPRVPGAGASAPSAEEAASERGPVAEVGAGEPEGEEPAAVPPEPVASVEPTQPAVPVPTPTSTPTPPPASETPAPEPTPVEPTPVEPTPVEPTPVESTPVEPTPPPEPVCEPWVGPIYVCHIP
ncbi:sigma factor [Streptomyces sp. SYP-A7185]|uniref:sigma factor n=1 Tax=Streptomyces sp. SYP-A7185 TaxID=3040076 RepID=UPI0038F6EC28